MFPFNRTQAEQKTFLESELWLVTQAAKDTQRDSHQEFPARMPVKEKFIILSDFKFCVSVRGKTIQYFGQLEKKIRPDFVYKDMLPSGLCSSKAGGNGFSGCSTITLFLKLWLYEDGSLFNQHGHGYTEQHTNCIQCISLIFTTNI